MADRFACRARADPHPTTPAGPGPGTAAGDAATALVARTSGPGRTARRVRGRARSRTQHTHRDTVEQGRISSAPAAGARASVRTLAAPASTWHFIHPGPAAGTRHSDATWPTDVREPAAQLPAVYAARAAAGARDRHVHAYAVDVAGMGKCMGGAAGRTGRACLCGGAGPGRAATVHGLDRLLVCLCRTDCAGRARHLPALACSAAVATPHRLI